MKKFMKWQDQLGTMKFKKGLLLLLGALIALISIPAAISAAASGGDTYIEVTLKKPDNYTYRDLIVKNVEILDPLDENTPVVNLLSSDYASSKALNLPTIGTLFRKFEPANGTYSHDGESIDVRITPEKTTSSLPGVYQNYLVYTERTFPDFSVIGNGTAYADDCGNVLLIKCPKNNGKEAAGLTELFKEPFKEGYLFNTEGILYFSTDAKDVVVWPSGAVPYNTSNLTYTLDNNTVSLKHFCPNMSAVQAFSPGGGQGEYAPEPGEYLIMVVKYDSTEETMRILAAMPVLILESDTKVIWSEENPYYKDSQKSVTISFNETVDNISYISYALVKKDPSYDLDINVDTRKLAEQGMDVTNLDGLIPILHAITQSNSSITYTLKPNGQEATLEKKYGGLVIAEGYGCAGYANSNSVEVAAATLQKLSPGDYYLYAMGIKDQKVVAIDQMNVSIAAVEPTPTPTYRPGGGGGGGSSSSKAPASYTSTGTLLTSSAGTVLKSIKVNAEDNVGSLFIPTGTKALDANGNPLTEVGIEPLASDAVPAVPAGAVFAFAGYAYVASPAGATFDPAITLTLEIPEDVWNTLDLESEQLSVKWYNEETGLWEDVPTTFDPETRTVRATVTHFSIFALFTEPIEATVTPIETPTTTTTTTTTAPAASAETSAEGLPVTMILGIFVVVIIIAAAGYFLLKRK